MTTKEELITQLQTRVAALEKRVRTMGIVPMFRPVTQADTVAIRSEIILDGVSHKLALLDAEELAIFNAQFPMLLAPSSGITRQVQLQRVEAYIVAIRTIKQQLDGVPFRGLQPGDSELGFQAIRPQFTHDPDTSTYRKNWEKSLVANRWTAFIGTNQTTGYKVGDDFGIVVTHATSFAAPRPFAAEFRAVVSRRYLAPYPLRGSLVRGTEIDSVVYPLSTLVMVPKSYWFVQLLAYEGGTEHLEMGGLVIGLGRALAETTASWT